VSNLAALINTVITENPDEHPHKLALLVAQATDKDDVFEFYVTALGPMVADRIRLNRNHTMNAKQGRSAKIEERRTWWQRVLLERVHVGKSTYKPIAACTVDDLTYCISERQDQIGALQGQIDKFQTIVNAMIAANVETAGDLPEGSVEL